MRNSTYLQDIAMDNEFLKRRYDYKYEWKDYQYVPHQLPNDDIYKKSPGGGYTSFPLEKIEQLKKNIYWNPILKNRMLAKKRQKQLRKWRATGAKGPKPAYPTTLHKDTTMKRQIAWNKFLAKERIEQLKRWRAAGAKGPKPAYIRTEPGILPSFSEFK